MVSPALKPRDEALERAVRLVQDQRTALLSGDFDAFLTGGGVLHETMQAVLAEAPEHPLSPLERAHLHTLRRLNADNQRLLAERHDRGQDLWTAVTEALAAAPTPAERSRAVAMDGYA